MLLEVCRWLVPAALSAAGGVALALWAHDGELPRWSDPPVAAAAPERDREPQSRGTGQAEAIPPRPPPPGRPTPVSTSPEQFERLARRLDAQTRVDVEAALAALLALHPRPRDYLAEDVIRQAAERAPQRTLRWIEENVTDASLRERLLSSAYAGVAVVDPVFALNRAQTLTDPDARRFAAHRVLETWAKADPAAAFEWVRAEQGGGATELLVTVMQAYTEHLPEQAGELVVSLPPGEARHRLVDQYASTLADSDAPAAAAWLSQLPDDAATASALSSVFERWAEQDPWTAIEQANRTEGELAFELVGKVVQSMGSRRPEELAASLDRLPEEYRALAAHQLAGVWADEHPRLARQWVDALPAGEVRDQARRGLKTGGRRG